MKVSGGCHCGNISYQAEVDSDKVGICHCSDCQMLSGSAFRTIVLTTENGFWLTSGQLKEYIKIGDSGNERIQSFCPNCGSPIYSAPTSEPKIYSIRVGTLEQRNELTPKFQIWCRSALDWIEKLECIESVQTQ